ncbi:uncharacterized protein LOC125959041 [Anopheles darlingi]|uniref:uncharacterized protein LOC125959041 n=1 Tax=Anopheles darlingi TaxID=43151 RepID=UPI0020FFF96E|nr:uncharacterized protein LOC125959041 [Anopheles darlingi]
MDQLSNRNRKNILSLNHGGNWSVPVVTPATTGMATAQLHPIRHQQQQQQQQQHLPRDVNGQQHHPTIAMFGQPQPQDTNHRSNHHLHHHHHHHHQHLQHQQHQQQQQQQQQHQLQIDGLPKAFVAAMRTLFDIMDDRKTGFVRLADIEDRWLDDGSKGMPRGVIDSLRKVTPPSGMLSFERFCIGLKMCLVRNQPLSNGGSVDSGGSSSITTNTIAPTIPSPALSPPHAHSVPRGSPQAIEGKLGKLSLSRPPSAPLLDLDGALGLERKVAPPSVVPSWSNSSGVPGSNTATVRPNNAMPAQKTLSMPQLLSPDEDGLEPPPIILPGAYGPPKPPRVSLNLERSNQHQHQLQQGHHTTQGTGPALGSSIDKAEIRNALQNWQMSLLMGEASADKTVGVEKPGHGGLRSLTTGRGSADGQTDLSTSSPSLQSINQLDGPLGRSGATILPASLYQKKSTVYGGGGGSGGRRREPRRHTLQNGVDYNMLKRLKQIEQEKDILVQGLTAVEQTRDWYLKQLAVVQEKIRYLGRPGSHMETWTETQQERLDLQRARVLEVNRHLMMLAESWERGGFPMHMNLALRPLPDTATYGSPYQPQQQQRQQHQHQRTQSQSTPPAVPPPPSSVSYQSAPSQQLSHQHHHLHLQQQQQQQPPTELVNHLKAQNHQLVEEVTQKNEKLSLLEREKAALIRELMQLQRANRAASMISNTEEMVF